MTALLRTEGIKKAYGGVQALDGATIAVDEGTIAGLIGPNGSGKTTLFNVMTGYQRADEGQVLFGDRVTVLDSGAVVAAGPPAIIRTDRRVLDAYLGEDLDPESAEDA